MEEAFEMVLQGKVMVGPFLYGAQQKGCWIESPVLSAPMQLFEKTAPAFLEGMNGKWISARGYFMPGTGFRVNSFRLLP